jgi:hypothetical protein
MGFNSRIELVEHFDGEVKLVQSTSSKNHVDIDFWGIHHSDSTGIDRQRIFVIDEGHKGKCLGLLCIVTLKQ